jgi:hypothetical protein
MPDRRLLRRVETTRRKREQARQDFREAILAAQKDGWPLRAIGEASGLSYEAVRLITQGDRLH